MDRVASWLRGGLAFGLATLGVALLASPADAASCRRDCNMVFRGCVADARTSLTTCREDCGDDVGCRAGCIPTFQDDLAACRSDREGCFEACPPLTCRADCAKAFAGCTQAANEVFRFDCVGDMCNQTFMTQRAECEELEPDARRSCIIAANRARTACLADCRAKRRDDLGVCRADRDTCFEACQ